MRKAAVSVVLLGLIAGCRAQPSAKTVVAQPTPISGRVFGGETQADLGEQGTRIVIGPSFGRYNYYVSFSPRPIGCWSRQQLLASKGLSAADRKRGCRMTEVHLARFPRHLASPSQALTTERAVFYLPQEEYDLVWERLSRRIDHWHTAPHDVFDGTGLQVDFQRGGHVRSLETNIPSDDPDDPAAEFALDVQRLMLAYGPTGFVPRAADWSVRSSDEDSEPCWETALASSLNQGFGVGDSDCRFPSP